MTKKKHVLFWVPMAFIFEDLRDEDNQMFIKKSSVNLRLRQQWHEDINLDWSLSEDSKVKN